MRKYFVLSASGYDPEQLSDMKRLRKPLCEKTAVLTLCQWNRVPCLMHMLKLLIYHKWSMTLVPFEIWYNGYQRITVRQKDLT